MSLSAPATEPWEIFLAAHFAGYLLPRSIHRALPEEAAARFLDRIGGPPEGLHLVRAASAIAAHAGAIRELALTELPLLARGLSPRIEVETSAREGPLEGRIDVQATLKRRLEGRASHAVTRSQRPRLGRPEDVLVKAVARRLAGEIAALRAAGMQSGAGFSEGLDACEAALHAALSATPLRDVPDQPVTDLHERAAMAARGRGYAIAAALHRALHEALDSTDPEVIARAVAEGALLPLDQPARFELAVLVRLMQAVWARLSEREPGRWVFHRTAILADRREVADFERDDGARAQIFYNQAWLAPGPHDRGVRRYLGQRGRLRPDITIVVRPIGSAPPRAAVVEAKLSSDPEYLAQGYRQALLYCHEYASALTGWPKAVLVASSALPGDPSREDDAIAVGWGRWVPAIVLDGLFEGVLTDGCGTTSAVSAP
jgi:hypothetical protein